MQLTALYAAADAERSGSTESKMINEWNEISANEKRRHPSFYTESSDDNVRSFSDSDVLFAKRALLGERKTAEIGA